MIRAAAPPLRILIFLLVSLPPVAACDGGPAGPRPDEWRQLGERGLTIEYREADASLAPAFLNYARSGRDSVQRFFGESLRAGFRVRLYPDRASLTEYWRAAWNQPSLQPECWMIGSADASLVVFLSPRVWAGQACGHDGADAQHLQQVVTHEIVHVLHRQINPSPNAMQGLMWLVEGAAVRASGEFDASARAAVRTRVAGGYSPATLGQFWTGGDGYGVSASLVDYIDRTYGRATLAALLRATSNAGVLQVLQVTEEELIAGGGRSCWRSIESDWNLWIGKPVQQLRVSHRVVLSRLEILRSPPGYDADAIRVRAATLRMTSLLDFISI